MSQNCQKMIDRANKIAICKDYELELDRHEMVPANWGLDRIDEDSLPMDGEYHYEHNGAGVNVFILDTGIYREHFDFAAKTEMINQRTVTCGYDAFLEKDRIRDWEDKSTSQDHPEECIDTHGHGTHVTGIVGGLKSGVSKQVNLIAVKVFDTDLGGSLSTVLAGLDYVLKQQETQSSDESKPAIVNLSLSGPFCALLNDAVEALVEIGIVVVVSAGNDGSSSCSKSPGSSNKVITVSATDSNDNMVAYSNFGLCTNIFAPGHQIASSWIRHDHDVVRLSGTSLAAPHVTGGMFMLKIVE